eukprot:2663333-Heterocapsa_arctica.AAC.1
MPEAGPGMPRKGQVHGLLRLYYVSPWDAHATYEDGVRAQVDGDPLEHYVWTVSAASALVEPVTIDTP